jgi:hypothetical protein
MRVKISSRDSGKAINLQQFVGNLNNTWDECVFSVNEPIEEADAWFVIEDLDDDDRRCRVPHERVIFLTAETAHPLGFYDDGAERRAFLDQFAHIFTCHDIFRANVTRATPFLPWMINANHASVSAQHARDLNYFRNLDSLEKTRDLSVFCSTQTVSGEHRMRLRFVERLKEHFGDRLDWFGNGVNPLAEKWEGIAPYRYTIVLENRSAPDVITEKLFDAYLGLAYPIYWGAPNLVNYFPTDAFTSIDIRDLSGSIERIDELLNSNSYPARVPALLEAKELVLTEFHLYARLTHLARDLIAETPSAPASVVELEPLHGRSVSRTRKPLMRHLGESINKVGDTLVRWSLR